MRSLIFMILLAAFELNRECNNIVNASPVFFDSLFPSYQSTTPESVISDYRNRTHGSSKSTRNNVEFYAEIFGKLIGTVRDGFSTLIDDVRSRNQNSRLNATQKVQKVEKLKTQTMSFGLNDAMPNNNDIPIDGIQSTTPSNSNMKNDTNIMNKKDKDDDVGDVEVSSWSDVVQKIAKTKLKRSDIVIESNLPSNMDEDDEKFDFFDDDDDDEMVIIPDMEKQMPSLLSAFYERHKQRKKRIFASLYQLFTTENEELTLEPRNRESKLTFAIMKGNTTVAQVTPKQFLGIFHRGSDEHAEFQKRAKRMLQEAFYKYARIYLRARKGYKDARNLNRRVRDSSIVTESNEVSNDAKSSGVKAVENFAIFLLEIFGAMTVLTFGAVNQIQNSYDF